MTVSAASATLLLAGCTGAAAAPVDARPAPAPATSPTAAPRANTPVTASAPRPATPPTTKPLTQPLTKPLTKPLSKPLTKPGLLPDPRLTPGQVFPSATAVQVCVSGYSSRVRSVSLRVRRSVFASYRIDYSGHAAYELDHLVPLELGGDNSAANLWPQPRRGAGAADVKDHLENRLHALVCAGRLPLTEAQHAMEGNWWAANQTYGTGT